MELAEGSGSSISELEQREQCMGSSTHRKPAAYVSDRLLVPNVQAGPTPPSHTFLPGA